MAAGSPSGSGSWPARLSQGTSWTAAAASPRQRWPHPRWGCSPPGREHPNTPTAISGAVVVEMKRNRLSLLEAGSIHLVEVVSNDLPDAGPLQPDAVHIVIGDFNNLLQAEHPRLVGRGQLVHGNGAQPSNKIHCGGAGTSELPSTQ